MTINNKTYLKLYETYKYSNTIYSFSKIQKLDLQKYICNIYNFNDQCVY